MKTFTPPDSLEWRMLQVELQQLESELNALNDVSYKKDDPREIARQTALKNARKPVTEVHNKMVAILQKCYQ